jgi:hypothetical protein
MKTKEQAAGHISKFTDVGNNITVCGITNYTTPGVLTHTCKPSTWEAEAGGLLEIRSSSPAWETYGDSLSKNKTTNKKTPPPTTKQLGVVVQTCNPSTWEADTGR